MKKLLYTVLAAFAVSISMFTTIGCDDGETYAEQKKKEQSAIGQFLRNNDFVGPINSIS